MVNMHSYYHKCIRVREIYVTKWNKYIENFIGNIAQFIITVKFNKWCICILFVFCVGRAD